MWTTKYGLNIAKIYIIKTLRLTYINIYVTMLIQLGRAIGGKVLYNFTYEQGITLLTKSGTTGRNYPSPRYSHRGDIYAAANLEAKEIHIRFQAKPFISDSDRHLNLNILEEE